MLQFIDAFIFGMVLFLVAFLVAKVVISYANINNKISNFLPTGIFIVLLLASMLTSPGKEIRSKFSFFDKTPTWNDYGTIAVAKQCLILGSISSPEDALTLNVKINNLPEAKKELFYCCRDKVRSSISQDDFFKRNGDNGNIVLSAIYDCRK